ncbi:MAG: hypothetical protein FWC90_04870 [Oscillospiraceae bacterium]|nr:hypothetical protein [Oscillospiraceae bacterium]
MVSYIVPAISAIVVAVVGALSGVEFNRRRNRDKRAEKRVEIRMEESRLSMEMISAAASLCLATASALENQKTNGEMQRAKENALHAQEEYVRFLKRIASRQVAKV